MLSIKNTKKLISPFLLSISLIPLPFYSQINTQLVSENLPLVTLRDISSLGTSNTPEIIAHQKEYIDTSVQSENEIREVEFLKQKTQKQQQTAEIAYKEWIIKQEDLKAKEEAAEVAKRKLGAWASQMYKTGTLNLDSNVVAVFPKDGNPEDFLQSAGQVKSLSNRLDAIKNKADKTKKSADEAKISSEEIKAKADNALSESQISLQKASETQTNLETKQKDAADNARNLTTQVNDSDIKNGTVSPIAANQRVFNSSVVNYWNDYLSMISSQNIILPTNDELKDPGKLKTGLSPVPSVTGGFTPGAAYISGTKTFIVSKENATIISNAINALGANYSNMNVADTFTCQSLIAPSYPSTEDKSLPSLWNAGAQVNILDKVPGDIIYNTDAGSGLTQAGIYVGAGIIVKASASSGYVEANPIDNKVFGVNRPTVTPTANAAIPGIEENSPNIICDGIDGKPSPSATNWILPVSSTDLDQTVKFGDKNDKWKDEGAPGVEFTTATNAPVYNSVAGSVSILTNNAELGNAVIISQPDNTQSVYSHLDYITVKDGDNIAAGKVLGTAAVNSNDEKSSVFVTVKVDSDYIDPMTLYFMPAVVGDSAGLEALSNTNATMTGSGQLTRNGYTNGELPGEILCPISDGEQLRCDAAAAFMAMNAAYKADMGSDIQVSDGYRSYAGQIAIKATRENFAARPGTSNHGWGLATDLGGGINSFGTTQYSWMVTHANQYGWYKPSWSEPTGSLPEPWHWEFSAASDK